MKKLKIKSYLEYHKREVENFTKLGDKEKLYFHEGIVFFIEKVLKITIDK